jgi:hypothetical protein
MNDGEAVNYLAANGLPRSAALGVIDVLRAESGLNPTALNPKEGAYGIAQWTEGRKANLLAFAEARKEPVESLKLQLAFLLHELETVEKGTLDRLQLTKTVDEAVQVFVQYFEGPEKVGEVVHHAEEEAGLPFGPSVTQASGLQAAVKAAVTEQPDPKDSSPKIRATGKTMSESGQHFQGHAQALRSLLTRTVKL